jgi:DNA-directed RNA polymerase specialized sigma24 family protein
MDSKLGTTNLIRHGMDSSSSGEQLLGRVNRDANSAAKGAAHFDTTRWTDIMLCGQYEAPGGQSAFARLYQLYWVPLYAFVRRKGYSTHDAEDLIQGFFLHVQEKGALVRVDRQKGKFRSFLLASLLNYLSAEAQRARCIKRGGNCEFVNLDIEDAESLCLREGAGSVTAEKLFDAQWAMMLLEQAMIRLREQFTARGQGSTFDTLKVFLGNQNESPSYEEVAKVLGVSIGAAKTLIHRFRQQYSAIVRHEIARTVSDPAEVDEEVHALCDALIAADGRAGSFFCADRCFGLTSSHHREVL